MKTVIEMAREAGWDDHHAEFDTLNLTRDLNALPIDPAIKE